MSRVAKACPGGVLTGGGHLPEEIASSLAEAEVPEQFPSQALCALDLSDVSAEAVKFAAVLVKSAGGHLTCIHARRPDAPTYFTGANIAELERQRRDSMVQEHAAVRSFIGRLTDAENVDVRVGEGEPAAVIVDTAEEIGADMIVMGTRGRSGIERFWLGSVAEAVVRNARVPVLVVPRLSTGSKSAKVVCVVRNSEISRTALNRSAMLAGALAAELVVVNVLDHAQTGRTAQDLCFWASAEGNCAVQYVEKPAHGQARLLDQIGGISADLIVLGFERERFSVRTEGGPSVSDALRHTPSPILLIPKEYAFETNTSGKVQQASG
jgi:nucleotide-binding universal stress UspA family protein